MEAGISTEAKHAGVPIQQTRVGTMFTTFFSETKPVDWNTVKVVDRIRFGKFFQKMLENGVYLAPSQFEAGFVSTLHGDEIMDATISAVEKALSHYRRSLFAGFHIAAQPQPEEIAVPKTIPAAAD